MLWLICILTLILSFYFIKKIWGIYKGPVRWIYIEIIYNCFIKFFIGYLGLPSVLNYVTDVILIIVFANSIWLKKKGNSIVIPKTLIIFIGLYFLTTVLSFVANIYSPLLYIWGIRNNMRFLLFAIMCAVFLKKEDIDIVFDVLFGYFILNIIAVTYEFFFAGKVFHTGDSISGLYSSGNINGGNEALNWMLCIICVVAIVKYFHEEKKIWFMLICVLGSTYVAALSELKAFFLELALISVLAILLCKKSKRVFVYLGICAVAVILGINMLYFLFPQFKDFFAWDTIMNYLGGEKGYVGEGSINRMSAIPYVFEKFLTTVPRKIFGLGFGNADYSKFSFFTSPFYREYSWTAYQWFYGPFILIETGILGLLSFLAILGNYLKQAVSMKTATEKDYTYKCIAIIISVLSVIMLFYNQSLKLETSGYMVQLLLCIPYIVKNGSNSETLEIKETT